MLQLLHIENIAVIERADIELEGGLTVLSGETGAGKSIVIDSIGAILGRRVSRDLVRSGAKKGFVSAVFTELPPALCQLVNELDLAGDEGDTLHIQRQLTADGKSSCRVNMKPVSASTSCCALYFISHSAAHRTRFRPKSAMPCKSFFSSPMRSPSGGTGTLRAWYDA